MAKLIKKKNVKLNWKEQSAGKEKGLGKYIKEV